MAFFGLIFGYGLYTATAQTVTLSLRSQMMGQSQPINLNDEIIRPLLGFASTIALFLIPPTAVLGCVILTGYLGGAVAAYTRMGEPYPVLVPLSTAIIAWFGIWLREERLRKLLPLR